MILLDQSVAEVVLIGMQKSNRTYTFLHWNRKRGLFKGVNFHTMLAEHYKDIEGIGPTLLVEWNKE